MITADVLRRHSRSFLRRLLERYVKYLLSFELRQLTLPGSLNDFIDAIIIKLCFVYLLEGLFSVYRFIILRQHLMRCCEIIEI